MKKLMNWVLAATLICGASVFTSCSESGDNPSPENSKDRKEFINHTRQSLKAMAENLRFTTWNSINYFNTNFNQYVLLNPEFDKTISRTFGEQIQKSIKPFEILEGVEVPEGVKTDYKYMALVDLANFNYTFTATLTGFDVAENDDKGLEVVFPLPAQVESDVEAISVAIKGTGDTFLNFDQRLSNDSVAVFIEIPAQYDMALALKDGDTWTKYIYGTIKNTVQPSVDIETPDGSIPANPMMDAWNMALDLHAAIPDIDGFDLYFAIGQDPETHKAGLKIDYAHNGYKVLDATATLANTNGKTDLSQMTSSSSLIDIFTAIMAGNSIEDLQLTLLDCLTTTAKVSDCEKVVKLQNEMAHARRNYADQATIEGYVDQLNGLVSCSMSDKTLGQEIPMRLVTTKIGVDWWAVPGLNFADEQGYVALTDMLDKESIEYAFNIIDHGVDPVKNSIVVARQLMQAIQKLQTAFYDSKAAADDAANYR
jgi:hypothetical protein